MSSAWDENRRRRICISCKTSWYDNNSGKIRYITRTSNFPGYYALLLSFCRAPLNTPCVIHAHHSLSSPFVLLLRCCILSLLTLWLTFPARVIKNSSQSNCGSTATCSWAPERRGRCVSAPWAWYRRRQQILKVKCQLTLHVVEAAAAFGRCGNNVNPTVTWNFSAPDAEQ